MYLAILGLLIGVSMSSHGKANPFVGINVCIGFYGTFPCFNFVRAVKIGPFDHKMVRIRRFIA
jgi:hypothetical protein